MMDSYEVSQGEYGPKLTLEGQWTPELFQICEKEHVEEIAILTLRDPHEVGLNFLQDLPHVKCFRLLDPTVQGIAGIHALGELRRLYMSDYSGEPIDFLRFPRLKAV